MNVFPHRVLCCLGILILATGCTSVPKGLTPVAGFDLKRYEGKWYEVARLDHRFERGLENVTAEYSARPDGKIEVVNRGFKRAENRRSEIRGSARPLGDATTGSLAVTFFPPFASGYHVLVLDPAYRYAMVAGSSRAYLWILSRTPQMDQGDYNKLIQQAKAWGFPTEDLIRVPQG